MKKPLTDAQIIAAAPPALRAQIESDLIQSRLVAQTFDAIFNSVFHDDSDCCQRCGRKHRGGFGCNCGDQP